MVVFFAQRTSPISEQVSLFTRKTVKGNAPNSHLYCLNEDVLRIVVINYTLDVSASAKLITSKTKNPRREAKGRYQGASTSPLIHPCCLRVRTNRNLFVLSNQ